MGSVTQYHFNNTHTADQQVDVHVRQANRESFFPIPGPEIEQLNYFDCYAIWPSDPKILSCLT